MIVLFFVAWAVVTGFFRITARTISNKTADRFLCFYAALADIIVIAVYSIEHANQWDLLGNGMSILDVLEFVVWLGGLSAMIYLFSKRMYPFDIKERSAINTSDEESVST